MRKNLGGKQGNVVASTDFRQRRQELADANAEGRTAVAFPTLSSQITQAAHGFTVGKVVQLVSGTWVLASQATASVSDVMIGIVSVVKGVNAFIVTLGGLVKLPSSVLASGYCGYYLSTVTPGSLTAVVPTYGLLRPLVIVTQASRDRSYVVPSTGVSSRLYAYVRWNCTSTANLSECEICTSDGTRIASPTLGWIDQNTSIPAPEFGECWYQVEYTGTTATLDGVNTRGLYRAVRFGSRSSSVVAVIAAIGLSVSGSNCFKVQTSAGVDITTTINGVASINQVKLLGVLSGAVTAGQEFDIARPLSAVLDRALWAYIPDRMTGNRPGDIISIDEGCPFSIGIWWMHVGPNAEVGSGYCVVHGYASNGGFGSGDFRGMGFDVLPGSPVITGNGNRSSLSSTLVALPTGTDQSAAIATTAGTYKINITWTQDATTKRLTTFALAPSATPAGFTINLVGRLLTGGRSATWPT